MTFHKYLLEIFFFLLDVLWILNTRRRPTVMILIFFVCQFLFDSPSKHLYNEGEADDHDEKGKEVDKEEK